MEVPAVFPVYLGLGSNLGDSRGRIEWAFDRLEALFSGGRRSACYLTKPRDYPDQPDFINACFAGRPLLPPEETLDRLKDLEAQAGRRRDPRFPKGPRTLDLDILLWGDRIIRTPDLEIPHSRLAERQFVLVPLLELDPGLVHPATGVPLSQILAQLEDQGIYYLGF
ncbi:MAG: 2-amino-4-hydroxy-6-hydroxymethyldihydropteridine diphosphokinase [Spirochaetales bacterium]|nr:2-amino-4-hydroxy-6-hydroxymethyldihydropteridine diphosphokinase [Spirochaetales bacterium]